MIDVILLEDEPVLRQELGEFLDEEGYRATRTASLAEFEQQFQAHRHHLAVIDIGLPDGSGLQLIQRLRQSGHPLGIVIFSARGTTADRINGLDIGADHYLSKGCDLEELAATLAALARRLELRSQHAQWSLEVGPRRLRVPAGASVPLSQQDMLVLHCLMENAGNNVSRDCIVQALGADYLNYDQRRLDTQMRRLRRKVEEASGQSLPVKTLRNSGYCFHARARIVL
ncbi:response regulator transcription factor [Stutzerimonas kirkiae]|uniref:DNA-binding response regulator n=1 Tax=Stutzerimonas kirkiae TaxID=2211392 RepID=A0A4Q9R228_9GAMM|nr:response regulator transcription factor [Stutzerimonas kirkiae]TBU92184.1 DNA-binding response regulator [Stutzerimonas kirkiae]TBV01164.1 DNA-binding response regulator [Stutzerimonas kirkiae]TBV10467.1 DNA-binding response regulator [Stutzerimonas kirkiae]TBV13977.1 DNA-binding response regulator [Stutzerimonas kirkiae]